jgi:hypothetical protein
MPALRYITQPVQLPYPRAASVAQSLTNIEYLSNLKATGLLDRDAADGLINDQRVIRDGLIECQLTAARGGLPEQVIKIEGGLPSLPLTLSGAPGSPARRRPLRVR